MQGWQHCPTLAGHMPFPVNNPDSAVKPASRSRRPVMAGHHMRVVRLLLVAMHAHRAWELAFAQPSMHAQADGMPCSARQAWC